MLLTTGIIETGYFHIERTDIKAEEVEISLAQKDPKAFEPLYLRYFERISHYVYHRVESKEIAFDLTANTFYNALSKLSSYKSKGLPFSAWLYRIAFNEVQQHYRGTKTQGVLNTNNKGVSEIMDSLPENSYPINDEQLFEAIEQLKEQEIELINMRFFENRSFKEIADILTIGESACKMKLYRILEKIKNSFTDK
ncbi:MAG: RNA polymerase sigma factor [Bacteroidota bacterium]|nr:RNA polymerase sigma factor [Bacteroidota bacterium]